MASTAKKAASADNDQRQKSLEEPPKTVALDEMTKAKNSSSLSLQEEKDIADSTILEQFAADKTNFAEENCKLPKWLYKYLLFRFNLLDRTGERDIEFQSVFVKKPRRGSAFQLLLISFSYSSILFDYKIGDGVIDHEEFEYVLSEFGVSERMARQAFTIFTQVGQNICISK